MVFFLKFFLWPIVEFRNFFKHFPLIDWRFSHRTDQQISRYFSCNKLKIFKIFFSWSINKFHVFPPRWIEEFCDSSFLPLTNKFWAIFLLLIGKFCSFFWLPIGENHVFFSVTNRRISHFFLNWLKNFMIFSLWQILQSF